MYYSHFYFRRLSICRTLDVNVTVGVNITNLDGFIVTELNRIYNVENFGNLN